MAFFYDLWGSLMARPNINRGRVGVVAPTDDDDPANKKYVDDQIAALDLSGSGGGGGLYGADLTAVTHSADASVALNMASGAYVFDIDLAANITGLNMSNEPVGASMLVLFATNSTGTAKTIDLTGETGVILEDELQGVVSVAAGETFAGTIIIKVTA